MGGLIAKPSSKSKIVTRHDIGYASRGGSPPECALRYGEKGIRIFPVKLVDCSDGSVDKKPLIKDNLNSASCDRDQITKWWTEFPTAAIGFPTGAINGVFVVDVDTPEGHGTDGVSTWRSLEVTHGPIDTFEVETATKGRHKYFLHPGGLGSSVKKIGEGIDHRGDGGWAVAPGSVTPNGRRWTVVKDFDLKPLPAWVAEAVANKERTALDEFVGEAREGETDAGLRELNRLFAEIERAPKGEKHSVRYRNAAAVGNIVAGGEVLLETARAALEAAIERIKNEGGKSDAEVMRDRRKDIEDGLEKGLREPRLVRRSREEWEAYEREWIASWSDADKAVCEWIEATLSCEWPRTEFKPFPKPEPEVRAANAKAKMKVGAPGLSSAPARWMLNDKGKKLSNLANVITLFEVDRRLKGLFQFNELSHSIDLLAPPPMPEGREPLKATDYPRELQDNDLTTLLDYTQHAGIATQSRDTIIAAVESVARKRTYHPFRDYLDGLKWDGVSRCDNLFLKYYHATGPFEYLTMVSRFLLLGLVKRAYFPGCQNDYMVVLEGDQGKRKTRSLEILCGKFFGGGPPDIHTKDFKQYLAGKMLVEIAELDAMRKADISATKRIITEKVDDYRPPYGKLFKKVPRTAVFIGTTNDRDTNKDVTGARRFWYVAVGERIELEDLEKDRVQLFAEAVTRMRGGERYWPTPEEEQTWFRPEQDARFDEDEWTQPIAEWIAKGGNNLESLPGFTGLEAVTRALGIPSDRYGRVEQLRVRRIFIWLGCTQPKNPGRTRRYWLPPEGGLPGYASPVVPKSSEHKPTQNVLRFPPDYDGRGRER
jgi:predicted P-loop ATPase